MARATRVWQALKTLVWHERLAASPTDALYTVYKAVAPDQLAYTISQALVGDHHRDEAVGPADADAPSGSSRRSCRRSGSRRRSGPSVANARVLGEGDVGGKPVWVVSFFDPVTPAWFEARIEKSTGRTLVLDMTAVAHFMHHVYGPFDAPFELHPPSAT